MKYSLLLLGCLALGMCSNPTYTMNEQTSLTQTNKISYSERAGFGGICGTIIGGLTSSSCIFTPQCNDALRPIDNHIGFAIFVLMCPLLGAGASTLAAYVKNKVEQRDPNGLI
jgi:hypothetical protein